MRIISGTFKGKKIIFPKNKKTRPLRDMVKESIFNLIENSNKLKIHIKDSSILDLFSGSGSFGLECISREAEKVTFVENDLDALTILKKNINKLKGENRCNVVEGNCFNYLNSKKNNNSKSDFIFLDPPFREEKINDLVNMILELRLLTKHGVIIIHRHKKDNIEISKKLNVIDDRLYGISRIIIGN